MDNPGISRRSFLALAVSAVAPFALRAWAAPAGFKKIPVGLEMYSVREALKQDADATVKAVAHAGYEGLEFYGPYFEWTEARTKEMRKLLDSLGWESSYSLLRLVFIQGTSRTLLMWHH